MSAYVLIITLAMSSYDGGVAVQWIPFASSEACEKAAHAWDKRGVGQYGRTYVTAQCHATK